MAYRPVVAPPPGAPPMMMFTQPQGSVPAAPVTCRQGTSALLLNFDGANGSTTMTDSSVFARTATRFGNAQLSTAQSKFGGSSLLLDGSGDYLQFPVTELWLPPTGLTIQAFIRPQTVSAVKVIATTRPTTGFTTTGFSLFTNASGQLSFVGWDATGTVTLNLVGATAMPVNTWAHVAVTRNSGVWRLFLNGALQASGTPAGTITQATSQGLFIGTDPAVAGRDFFGHIDAFQFHVGPPEWVANFTPPTVAPTP